MKQGDRFGSYEIVRLLGRGMTDVYLARDFAKQRLVVLKVVQARDDSHARAVIEAEARGAQLQQQLHAADSHILNVYEWGELKDQFFVALEYFPGRTLAQLLATRRKLEPRLAVRYAREVCGQLRRLHEFAPGPVIHGDIKPSNIQISDNGQLRLLDFGIAKTIRPGHDLTHHELGSPSYCSPERLREYRVDVQADLWATGVTLYEMATGTLPFQARDTRQLEALIQTKPALDLPPDCPARLASILRKALAPDWEDRFESAAAFEQELAAYLEPMAETKKTIVRRRSVSYPAAVALLAGMLAGLALFLPVAYHLRLEKISRVLLQPKDYSRLPAAALASDWRLYQTVRSRSSWWRSFVPTARAEANFQTNVVRSAASPPNSFAQGKDVNWPTARFCALSALEFVRQNRAALATFHLANGFVFSADPKRTPGESYREFRKAAQLLPKSPVPHLGLARLYAYRLHNVTAALAEWQRAEALGYHLQAREAQQQADLFLYRAESELKRAKDISSTSKGNAVAWLRSAENDLERARQSSQNDETLARIEADDAARANFETVLLTPPSPKPHMVLLKVRWR